MNSGNFWKVIAVTVAATFVLSACNFCPPAGPWPQPPGCGVSDTSPQSARDDLGCFPPSCDMIPDEAARIMCEQFKAGQDVWSWPRDCTLLPTNSCSQLCESEKQRYIDVGRQNWEAGIKNDPDWWKEPYTKVFIFGSTSERLEIFEPDARPWGAAPDEEDLLQMEIAYSHYYNMPYAANNFFNYVESIDPDTGYHLVAYMEDQVPEELRPAIRRTLEGEIARNAYIPGIGFEDKSGIYFTGFYPAFVERNIAEWKRMVDLGADGVMIDNLQGIPPNNKDLVTRFNDYTMQEFGKYLAETLSAQDWESLGAEPGNFNYADYLRTRGYSSDSFKVEDGSWEEIPLILDLRAFIAQENAEAFQRMSEEIRAYAASQGRVITVSANMTDRVGTTVEEPYVDFVTSEFGYVTEQPYQYRTVVPFSKFSRAKGKDYLNVVVLENYVPMTEFARSDHELYADIYRLGIMESYAARSSQIFLRAEASDAALADDPQAIFRLRQDTTLLEQVKPAYDFMRRYKSYFADFNTSTARLGLLYFNDLAYEFFLDDPGDQHYWDVYRLGEKLYRLGLDYDVIAPSASFDQYDMLVLPRSAHIPEADAQKLLEFVTAGGKLVMLNQPGEGGALLQPGTHETGEIIQFDPDDKDGLAALVAEEIGALQSDSIEPLLAVSYTDGRGNYVVHLFTSHTDLGQNFPVLETVHLTLPFPIEGSNVSYASLENPDPVSLDAGNIVIPSIKTYGLLIIEKP